MMITSSFLMMDVTNSIIVVVTQIRQFVCGGSRAAVGIRGLSQNIQGTKINIIFIVLFSTFVSLFSIGY